MLLADKIPQSPSQNQIATSVYQSARGGSLQLDMQSYLRQQGLLAYTLPPTLTALLAALEARQPVLVLQNLAFDFFARWHYAVALGFTAHKQQLILHSGVYRHYHLKLSTFARTWARADNWALVALAPDALDFSLADATWLHLPVLLDEMILLDELGNLKNPLAAYRQLADLAARMNQPQTQAMALFRLGNHQYPQNPRQAARHFAKSAQLAATPWALNNLAAVYLELGCWQKAKTSIAHALALDPNYAPSVATQRQIQAQAGKALPICQLVADY